MCGLYSPTTELKAKIFLHHQIRRRFSTQNSLLKKAKLAREISDGKNKIPHKFLSRKIQ